jgi:hypothetical protein
MENTAKYIKLYNYYVSVCRGLHKRPKPYPVYKQELINSLFGIDDVIKDLGL